MATMTLPLPSGRARRPSGILQALSDMAHGIAQGRQLAARYDALSRKSDSELARMGLTRADIPAAVVKGL